MDERVRLQTCPQNILSQITYFDSYGMTFENGPALPCTFSNGPGVAVDVDIDANKRTFGIWYRISISLANSQMSSSALIGIKSPLQ